jgi:hypothetical protein
MKCLGTGFRIKSFQEKTFTITHPEMSRSLRFPLKRSASVDTINFDNGSGSNHSNTPTEHTNVIDRFRSQLKRAASFSALHPRKTIVEVTDLREAENFNCCNQEPKPGRIAFSALLRVATEQAMMKPKRRKRSTQVDDIDDEMYDGVPIQAKSFVESNVQPIHVSCEDVQEQRLRSKAHEISNFLEEVISSSHITKVPSGPAVPQRGTTRRLSYNQEYSKREEDRRQARTVAASLVRAHRLKKEFSITTDLKRPTHTAQRKKMTRRSSSMQKTKLSLHGASEQVAQHPSTTRLLRRRTEVL